MPQKNVNENDSDEIFQLLTFYIFHSYMRLMMEWTKKKIARVEENGIFFSLCYVPYPSVKYVAHTYTLYIGLKLCVKKVVSAILR